MPSSSQLNVTATNTARLLSLKDDELQLLVELLENERRELPAEIHRTDATDYKLKLAERLKVVDRLLDALQKQR